MKAIVLFIALVVCYNLPAQGPHPNAHAHNDYLHERPLLDAIQNGFTSIEADVHLVKDQLWVGHNRVNKDAKTLEALYLFPLDSLVRNNGGSVYPGYQQPVFLMIDVKTEATPTILALQKLLKRYEPLFLNGGPLKVFVSGNRSYPLLLQQNPSMLLIDGRPGDLGKNYDTHFMPVISENYHQVIHWNGKGNPSAEELIKLKSLAQQVHKEGKKLRLWAIPDNETAWQVLIDAGVDLINSDHLPELNAFLTKKGL